MSVDVFCCLMYWRPPRSTRTDTRFPDTTRCRSAPVHGAGFVIHAATVERHRLAVALHRQLLQVGREALEVLRVRQYGDRVRAEEIVVPDRDQRHQHRQVALERRVTEIDRKSTRLNYST